MTVRIGIDWGGTKIEAIALDETGAELIRRRVATPKGDYSACIASARDLVLGIEREIATAGSIGVGIPGTLSPATGLVKNANSTWLNGRPLKRDLESAFGRPVRVQNDANCLAVSEARDGAVAGAHVVLGVILGTGCGSGIAIDGEALEGHQGIAGEFGHVPLPWVAADEHPGARCWCGRNGCLETFISGSGFERDYFETTGTARSPQAIVEAAQAGDAEAAAAYRRYAERLARGLALLINILDPDAIVLGGGMSNIDALYADLPDLIAPFVFSDQWHTPIVRARHGDSSGVRGAAGLWET
ncbi:ROK family protein [Breoghania sp. L-A4]|uniref:ROK family protein n=1 Tax=Breoghania sp. L-A4 TaxID=2304600 RepID=UPI000E35EDB0|nr:ROK family protein [Breoghania sp. L-A4]AXS40024.1 ROK family protein [Breoghania sp. L-A4]